MDAAAEVRLPLDAVVCILTHLDHTALRAAALTCRSWRLAESAAEHQLWGRHFPTVAAAAAKTFYLRSGLALESRERSEGRMLASLEGGSPVVVEATTCFAPLDRWLERSRAFLDTLAPRRFSVLLTGLPASGKTSVLNRLTRRPASWAEPPGGQWNIARLAWRGSEVHVYDQPMELCLARSRRGGERYDGFSREADGVVFVSDGQQPADDAAELAAVLSLPELAGLPLLVLATKQDLALSPPPSSALRALGLGELRSRAWRIQGCCAAPVGLLEATREDDAGARGVVAGFDWLVGAIRRGTSWTGGWGTAWLV